MLFQVWLGHLWKHAILPGAYSCTVCERKASAVQNHSEMLSAAAPQREHHSQHLLRVGGIGRHPKKATVIIKNARKCTAQNKTQEVCRLPTG